MKYNIKRAVTVAAIGTIVSAILAVIGMYLVQWSAFPEMNNYGAFLMIVSACTLIATLIASPILTIDFK